MVGHPEFSSTVEINSLGLLRYQSSAIVAKGLSLKSIEERLRDALSAAFGFKPKVKVQLAGRASEGIFADGMVEHPGLQRWSVLPGLDQVLSLAQISPDGDSESVQLEAMFSDTAISDQTTLKGLAGDRIYVGRRTQSADVMIVGGVVAAGAYKFVTGQTLGSALELAGGLSQNGDSSRIFLVRRKKQVGPFDLSKDSGYLIQAGDGIRVEMLAELGSFSFVPLSGSPESISLTRGLTLLQFLIDRGFTREPRGLYVSVQGLSVAHKPMKKMLVADLISGKVLNPTIELNDIVTISRK